MPTPDAVPASGTFLDTLDRTVSPTRSVLAGSAVAVTVKATTVLSVSVDDAIERVLAREGGLRVVRSGSGAEFHTASGLWVATLRPDDEGSRLLYRTGPTTPILRHAVRQAERLLALLRD